MLLAFVFLGIDGNPVGFKDGNQIGGETNLDNLVRNRREPQESSAREICTTVYESECKTIYEEREVDEDTIECETVQQEKCKEVKEGCVLNCEPICVKLPAKKCKVETKKVIKYIPGTKCNKVPSKVCGPRSGK